MLSSLRKIKIFLGELLKEKQVSESQEEFDQLPLLITDYKKHLIRIDSIFFNPSF